MNQIRSDILFACKKRNARECEREMQRLHIATPICPDDESEGHEDHELNEEEYIQVSDDENELSDRINIGVENNNTSEELVIEDEEQKWSQLIEEWIELGRQENLFENDDDESFLSSEWNSDFNFAGRNVHPANDKMANRV